MTFLVGVNPGQRSASTLHLAAMLARSADTDLVVAAIVPQTWPKSAGRADAEWQKYTHQTANVVLDHAAAVLGDSVKAEYLLHEASSARRGLLELVDDRGCDLVVVGSSTAGPLGRIALGSESDALVHASHVPVAIAPRGFRTNEGARVGRVTAAYGGTEAAADLVIGAAGIAAQVGASLRIASFAVVPTVSGTSGTGLEDEQRIIGEWANDIDRHAERLIGEVSSLPRPPKIDGTVIGMGHTWESAIEDVEWDAGDVLVVGSSSLGPIARVFLGSHAAKVVRNSPVPVVVVPRRAAQELVEEALDEEGEGLA